MNMAEQQLSIVQEKEVETKSTLLRRKHVEEVFSPLIEQITSTSLNYSAKSSHRKSCGTQKVSKMVHLFDKATRNFIAVGEEISNENPEYQEELLLACDEVRSSGEVMQNAANQFARDTCNPNKRAVMLKASRDLLMSVVRLLVVADEVDTKKLLQTLNRVEKKLRSLLLVRNEAELMDTIKGCSSDISHISQLAALRQREMNDRWSYHLLSFSQLQLNQASKILICSSKTFLHYPSLVSAEENQQYTITVMVDALKTLTHLASGDDIQSIDCEIGKLQLGELALIFREFKVAIEQSTIIATQAHKDSSLTDTHLAKVIESHDKIVSAALQIANAKCTRDYNRCMILNHCGDFKSMLQQYSKAVAENSKLITGYASDLKVVVLQLLKESLLMAVADLVSESFVNCTSPLSLVCEAAHSENRSLLDSRSLSFFNHVELIGNACELACTLCDQVEDIEIVKASLKRVQGVTPQVVNAAYTLRNQSSNVTAQKNLSGFSEAWKDNISLLNSAVDGIIPVHHLIAVTGETKKVHIHGDGLMFLKAMESWDCPTIHQAVLLIEGRCTRLVHIVKAELKDNSICYSEEQAKHMYQSIGKLMDKSLLWFTKLASTAVQTVEKSHDSKAVNYKALEESLQKLIEDVKDICRVIMPQNKIKTGHVPLQYHPSQSQENNSNDENEKERDRFHAKFQRSPRQNSVALEGITREAIATLAVEQKAQLTKVALDLSAQKDVFETEVSIWDESENDIVMLAKEICSMMMDMSDFTRDTGPLCTITDVIMTARDVVRAGEKFNQLARSIADQCSDEQCAKNVLVYCERLDLHCHQLKITAAVKEDPDMITSETVENIGELISIATNLMFAVVETVKASYIASTAIARAHDGQMPNQFIQWKLTMPKKKKLYRADSSSTRSAAGEAIHQLALFRPEKIH